MTLKQSVALPIRWLNKEQADLAKLDLPFDRSKIVNKTVHFYSIDYVHESEEPEGLMTVVASGNEEFVCPWKVQKVLDTIESVKNIQKIG